MKKLNLFIKIFIFFVIIGIMFLASLYLYVYFNPKIDIKTMNQFYIYDNNDELVYSGSSTNEWVKLEDISDYLIMAIINTEDKNFYTHKGFDYLRIGKAMINNIKKKDIVEGASTISQQYIKNLFLDFEKTWKRKIDEAFLTIKLEMHYNKEEILEGYLNTINYGQGNYGISNASKYYFNKKPKDLSLEESIFLAAIPRSPNNYNPVSNYDLCKKRAEIISNLLLKNKAITKEEFNNLNFDLNIYGKNDNNNLQTLMYYQEAVINELKNIDSIPKSFLKSGGLKIYTNLDLEAQSNLETAISNNMQADKTQIASIMVDPKTGGIIALTGGKNYQESTYNRATKSYRQVGSTMKPILYYSALENGMTGVSTFLSAPSTFVFSNNQLYSPSNYGDKYGNKNITMGAAIAYSDNIYAVKTHLFLGEDMLVKTAKKMGLKGSITANPSLALGTSEINLVDFAQVYTSLASGGYERELSFIRKIEDSKGNTLYEKKNINKLILNENIVYILNDLLTTTYDSNFIDYSKPTFLSLASKLSRKYAIKSGSTNTDYVVVGYNPDLLMLVWTGNDDNSFIANKYSSITKNIWAETMENTLSDTKETWYELPDNVVGLPLNAISGEKESNQNQTKLYYFVKGSEPIVK